MFESEAKFALHIGPATLRKGAPQIKVSVDQIGTIESIGQLDDIVTNINDLSTTNRARQFMGCPTCKAAKWCQSEVANELDVKASRSSGSTKISVTVGCDALVYAASNGFVQDAACMKSKKPIHVVVGTSIDKPGFFDTLRTIFRWF